MTGATKNDTGRVAVVESIIRPVEAGGTRLRHSLVDDAVELLPDKDMIVPVKDYVHLVLHKQLVNRHPPSRAFCSKAVGAIGVFAAPFVQPGSLCPAAAIHIQP